MAYNFGFMATNPNYVSPNGDPGNMNLTLEQRQKAFDTGINPTTGRPWAEGWGEAGNEAASAQRPAKQEWYDSIVPALAMAGLTGGIAAGFGAGPLAGAGSNLASGGGVLGANGMSASDLAKLGYEVNGMPMTGPGGIGSASSVSGAGAGAAGYGDVARNLLSMHGYTGNANGAPSGLDSSASANDVSAPNDPYANETAKLAAQNSGPPLMPTNLSTTSLLDGATTGMSAADMAKAASSAVSASKGLLGALGNPGGQSGGDVTIKKEIDPRLGNMLYGPNGNDGLLSQLATTATKPMSPGLLQFGQNADNYLLNNAPEDQAALRKYSQGLLSYRAAPPQIRRG